MIFWIFRSLVHDCKEKGYKFACGGEGNIKGLDKGHFLPIAIVDNPPEDARVVQEERRSFCDMWTFEACLQRDLRIRPHPAPHALE